ncbi:class III signal peptide-containing protein [Methanothermobacter tenebrarum]
MDDRGQLSVEYLLLVFVIILILGGVTIPLVGRAIDASNDVSRASDAKVAVESIADAADVVYSNGPGAKRTVSFYIPQDGTLGYSNNMIYFTITFSNNTMRNITAKTQYSYNLTSNSIQLTRGWHTATITWPLNTRSITITIA